MSLRQPCRRDIHERTFLKSHKTHELRNRLLFTGLILVAYMAGRSVLLYQVDSEAYAWREQDSQNIVEAMVSGDRHQYTLFALGIMPYITATLMMWIYTAARGSEFRSRLSPKRMERLTWLLMLAVAAASAISRAEELIFRASGHPPELLKAVAVLEMTFGAVLIYRMTELNKEHGMGGQASIMLINMLDSLYATVRKYPWEELRLPLLLCLGMAAVILIMENSIVRIPVQRVSIHNTYADKSYIAYKLDPIGVMPVMFAVSFFMLPQLAVSLLLFLDGDNAALLRVRDRLNLTDALGAGVYLGIIILLDILFSFLMLSPGQAAEQLQKGGDSIVGVYAGRKTKRYLRRKVLGLSLFSGCILSAMMGLSLGLSLLGEIPSELALFPTTAMILTGILCTLYREVKSYRRFDSYSFFM